jgi:hypothetical protein
MNTPSQGSTSWYSAVDANWTSIETNLIDKRTATAKGDLLAASASGTVNRLGVGADGQVLLADSTQATGLKWGDDNSAGAIHSASSSATTPQQTGSTTMGLLDGMSVQISVSSAQKVLAIFSTSIYNPAPNFGCAVLQLMRGSTVLRQIVVPAYGGGDMANRFTIATLDQPGTGNFTYQVQWALTTSGFEVEIQQNLTPYSATSGDRQLILVALPG